MKQIEMVVIRNPEDVTREVLSTMERTADPRLREIVVSVAWLVNKLSAAGAKLLKGHTVLGGSFSRPIDIKQDDVVTANFGGLDSINLSFV